MVIVTDERLLMVLRSITPYSRFVSPTGFYDLIPLLAAVAVLRPNGE